MYNKIMKSYCTLRAICDRKSRMRCPGIRCFYEGGNDTVNVKIILDNQTATKICRPGLLTEVTKFLRLAYRPTRAYV